MYRLNISGDRRRYRISPRPSSERLYIRNCLPPQPDAVSEILEGLIQQPRKISPKYFYNGKGAFLFDRITTQPEYYLTRVEREIYQRFSQEIAEEVGIGRVLIEPGSGCSEKVRLLLDKLRPSAYVPIEITSGHLEAAATKLVESYPWLTVHGICSDYSKGLILPETLPRGSRLIFFPGSTIGNFEPDQAQTFLRQLRVAAGDSGALLVGIDLQKDKQILHAAYNDAALVTAGFNLNILNHLNELAEADFVVNNFRHVAFYNTLESRVEMHLESVKNHEVSVAGETIPFAKGERIHTENSYKYQVNKFHHLAAQAGFKPRNEWRDSSGFFSVQLLEAV